MNQTYMKEKKILPLVLTMSLPMVLGMLVNALYNIVDSYFVAQISESAMTSISLVYPLQLIVTAVAVGHGIGVNAIASFYLGAQDQKKANDTVSLGLFLSMIHGVLLTVGCIGVLRPFLHLFTTNPEVIQNGITYGTLAFLFNFPNSIAIAYEKIYQAEGKMTVSMIAMLCGCICNIILDPMMIFGIGFFPKMGIAGAALATGIGQVLTLAIYLIIYFTKESQLRIHFSKEMFQKTICKRIYSVGLPATMNLSLPSIMITLLNGILAEFSDMYVLVLGIYYKLQTFIYLSATGIVQGIRPLVGYNYGAGEGKRVRNIYATGLVLTVFLMLLGTTLSWIMPERLFGLFTTNTNTLSLGVEALHIISIGFIVSAISVTTSGALEGIGMGLPSLIISLLRYAIVIMPAAFVLSRIFGATGVWMAFPIAETITGIASYIIWCKKRKSVIMVS